MNVRSIVISTFVLTTAALASAQDFILVPDSTADKIVKLDPVTGAIIDANFILDAGGAPYDFGTPKDVFQVNNEIWVIDQVSDSIFRFDSSGAWIATTNGVAGTLDNCRGGEFANGVVYVTNDGTGNGASADTVVMFDTAGVKTGQFSVADSGTSPFDVVEYNGELLVCHFTSVNTIGRYDYAGSPLGAFHVSGGVTDVDLPEQMWVTTVNTVLTAGFGTPLGVFEYDNTGALINTFTHTSALRGVCELGNGLLLITDGAGVKTYDRSVAGGAPVLIHATTGGQFFGLCSFVTGPVSYCTAGTSTTGCQPTLSGQNLEADFGAACSVTANNVDGQKFGILFYSVSGQNSAPWCGTSSSFLCVKAPSQRTPSQSSGGTAGACDGVLTIDVNNYLQVTNPTALGMPFVAGNIIDWQGWYRDPPACKSTQLTDGLEMTVQP